MPKRTFRKVFKMPTTFAHLVSVSANSMIGSGKDLPWSMSKEKSLMTEAIAGKHIIIGHNSYEKMKHYLDVDKCMVVSRHKDLHYPTYTLEQAITHAATLNDEVLILGGATIFASTWPIIDKVYMTLVNIDTSGDTFYDIDKLNQFTMNKQKRISEIIFNQVWTRNDNPGI